MLKELPHYDYVNERCAVVTWKGEHVFDLLQGKVTWIAKVDGLPYVTKRYELLEKFIGRMPPEADVVVTYRSKWYVVGDHGFEIFESEDLAKNWIERVLRVREIIRGRAKTST